MDTPKKNRRVEILGFASGALTSLALIPQAVLVWRMRPMPAIAISLPMYAAFCTGVLGWLIYGIKIKSKPVIFWNAITLCLALSVLAYKIAYG